MQTTGNSKPEKSFTLRVSLTQMTVIVQNIPQIFTSKRLTGESKEQLLSPTSGTEMVDGEDGQETGGSITYKG